MSFIVKSTVQAQEFLYWHVKTTLLSLSKTSYTRWVILDNFAKLIFQYIEKSPYHHIV